MFFRRGFKNFGLRFLKNFKILLGGLDFSSGEKLSFLELNNNVKVLPLICYEVIFPRITRLSKNNHDLIMIKGSNSIKLDKVCAELKKKKN